MKVEQHHSSPEWDKDRQPYRVRIEGRDGQAFEVVEQMGGGFSITGVTSVGSKLVMMPIGANSIIIEIKK